MSLISKMLYAWHYVRRNYHEELIESCLDYKLKAKLRNKYEYHEEKLVQLSSMQVS